VLLAALAGCTVGPVFEPPAVDAPRNWGPTIATVPSSVTSDGPDPRWWRSFNDPELNSLINRAVAQNLDLKTAAERILQGRSERDVVALEGLPHIREQSSYERFRYSTHGNPLGLVVPRPGATPEVDVYQNGFSSSWELDLFGRVRRGVEAANARTQSAVEDRNGVTLATEAELAQDYLSLRGTQALLVIAEGNLALAQENVRLADSRRSFGTATTLETAQARAQQEVIAERLPPYSPGKRRRSTQSACCWPNSPARSRLNCVHPPPCRPFPGWFPSACRQRWCGGARTSDVPRPGCMRRWRKPAWPSQASTRTSASPAPSH